MQIPEMTVETPLVRHLCHQNHLDLGAALHDNLLGPQTLVCHPQNEVGLCISNININLKS